MHNGMLFSQFVEHWLSDVAPLRYKPTALQEYRSLLRLHVLPAFGDCPLSEIAASDVQHFLTEQVESGSAPRSVRNRLVALRSVLGSAADLGLIESNVGMKVAPPREYREERRFLVPAQLNAVLEATSDAWKSLIALPIYTAARRGEALALRWAQVSFGRRQISFVRSMRSGVEYTTKTPASRASVAMAEELVPLLQARRSQCPDPVEGYVFCRKDGTPLSDATPGRQLKKACAAAGIEPCGYHTLRHSAIAALIATNAHPLVVSRFARHASIETTMDVYGHLFAPPGGDEVSKLSDLIQGS